MKTISLDEESYRLLKGAKISPRESFSMVVKRICHQKPSIESSAGAWSNVPAERIEQIKRERVQTFGKTSDSP